MPAELLFQKEIRVNNDHWETSDDEPIILGPVAIGQTQLFSHPDIGFKGISAKLITSNFANAQPRAEVTIGSGINLTNPVEAAAVWHEPIKIEEHRSGAQSTFAYIPGNVGETERWSATLRLSRDRQ